MGAILVWIQRIISIGVLEFLAKIGWKVWAGLLAAIVALIGLVIVLILIIVALLL